LGERGPSSWHHVETIDGADENDEALRSWPSTCGMDCAQIVWIEEIERMKDDIFCSPKKFRRGKLVARDMKWEPEWGNYTVFYLDRNFMD
jgi:hypothetical protein